MSSREEYELDKHGHDDANEQESVNQKFPRDQMLKQTTRENGSPSIISRQGSRPSYLRISSWRSFWLFRIQATKREYGLARKYWSSDRPTIKMACRIHVRCSTLLTSWRSNRRWEDKLLFRWWKSKCFNSLTRLLLKVTSLKRPACSSPSRSRQSLLHCRTSGTRWFGSARTLFAVKIVPLYFEFLFDKNSRSR